MNILNEKDAINYLTNRFHSDKYTKLFKFNTFVAKMGLYTLEQYERILSEFFCGKTPMGYSQLMYSYFEEDDSLMFYFPSNELLEQFLEFPQILMITGMRRSGKSVASFRIATEWKKRYKNGRVLVYGDWDHNTPIHHKGWHRVEGKYFPEKMVYNEKREYPILIIYDELTTEIAVGFHQKAESRLSDMLLRRIRHLGASESAGVWIIYLATTYGGVQKQKRLEADLYLDMRQVGNALVERLNTIPDSKLNYIYSRILPTLPYPKPNLPLNATYGLALTEGYKISLFKIIMPRWLREISEKTRIEKHEIFKDYDRKVMGEKATQI